MVNLVEMVHARISEPIGATNINDYIAFLTEMNQIRAKGIRGDPSYRNMIGMYVYLRDEIGAQTYGEAMEAIRQRKVDHRIVAVWVEADFCKGGDLYKIFTTGYPELQPTLDEMRRKKLEDHQKRIEQACRHA